MCLSHLLSYMSKVSQLAQDERKKKKDVEEEKKGGDNSTCSSLALCLQLTE